MKVLNIFSVLVIVLSVIDQSHQQNFLPSEAFDFIGATSTKELYISHANYTNDFADAIATCSIRFIGVDLVTVENEVEFALIDDYFLRTQGNSSDLAWTSLVQMGDIQTRWATGGNIYEGGAIDAPWPAGGGGSPTYAWYNCGSIRRICNRPPNSPPGCWPAYSNYIYTPCLQPLRFICQRTITPTN